MLHIFCTSRHHHRRHQPPAVHRLSTTCRPDRPSCYTRGSIIFAPPPPTQAPLLDQDDKLYAISAWNDNGFGSKVEGALPNAVSESVSP